MTTHYQPTKKQYKQHYGENTMIKGEVIELNQHRLLWGDATNLDDVNLLIGDCKVDLLLTDPPYGINIVNVGGGKSEVEEAHPLDHSREREHLATIGGAKPPTFKRDSRNTSKTRLQTGGGNQHMVKSESPGIVEPRLYKPVIGDDKPFNPQHLLDLNVPSIIFGANNFAHELPNNHRWLVWFKKPGLNFERNNFSDVELCWTNFKGKACLLYHHTWSGMVREGDRKVELAERVHPTQKPVGLLEQMILEFTNEGDVVLDLYGGGGGVRLLPVKEQTGSA